MAYGILVISFRVNQIERNVSTVNQKDSYAFIENILYKRSIQKLGSTDCEIYSIYATL